MVRRIGTGCDSIGWNVLKLSHRLIDFFFNGMDKKCFHCISPVEKEK
jgi:hypothetical protein